MKVCLFGQIAIFRKKMWWFWSKILLPESEAVTESESLRNKRIWEWAKWANGSHTRYNISRVKEWLYLFWFILNPVVGSRILYCLKTYLINYKRSYWRCSSNRSRMWKWNYNRLQWIFNGASKSVRYNTEWLWGQTDFW